MSRKQTHLYPLKKIVSFEGAWDVLECGHKLFKSSDMFGDTNPTKRRCHRCWTALTPKEQQQLTAAAEKRKAVAKAKEWQAWRKYSGKDNGH